MTNATEPVLKSVNPSGVEIDSQTEPHIDIELVAKVLHSAINKRYDLYRRGLVNETFFCKVKPVLSVITNDSVIELICTLRGEMNTFEKTRDAHGYSILGYHLNIDNRRYILESSMQFDAEVKFNWWKKVKMLLGYVTNPVYIGKFDYEFRLWFNEQSYYSIRIPYKSVIINDTYYIRTLRRYVGIPDNDHHEEIPFYLRRKYEQRRDYFAGSHS